MRRSAVLLAAGAVAALLLSGTAVLAGYAGAPPAAQTTVRTITPTTPDSPESTASTPSSSLSIAPAEAPAGTLKTTGASSTIAVNAPTAPDSPEITASTSGSNLSTAPAEAPAGTVKTTGAPSAVAVTSSAAARDEEQPKDSGGSGSAQGQAYTWEDGDRTLTVVLQTDLTVQRDADGSAGDIVMPEAGGGSIVRQEGNQAKSDDKPVFRSESGALMTLPGGILLVLNAEWSETETNAFFSGKRIKLDRVSELSYITNGFFVETEPGFPSLNLANKLAAQDGVEVSSPNWWTEITTR